MTKKSTLTLFVFLVCVMTLSNASLSQAATCIRSDLMDFSIGWNMVDFHDVHIGITNAQQLIVSLSWDFQSRNQFSSGDYQCARLCYNTAETSLPVDLYVVLEIEGRYYFMPCAAEWICHYDETVFGQNCWEIVCGNLGTITVRLP